MSFLTAEKKGPRCPLPRGGGGGKTYLGNARLKTFFCLDAFPYGSVYNCFSTYWALGLAQFTVDFVHNLYFQVRLVKYERHAVAHHTLYIQASGTNDTKSTTELSPVLIRILLRFQSLASTLDYSWGSLDSPPVFKVKL